MSVLRPGDLVSWTGEADADGRPWCVADPDQVYPATIAHIRAVLAGLAQPGPTVAQYVARARQLPPEAWDLALAPRERFEPDDARALAIRGEALEVARQWFTEALHVSVGYGPMALKLLSRPAWRLA